MADTTAPTLFTEQDLNNLEATVAELLGPGSRIPAVLHNAWNLLQEIKASRARETQLRATIAEAQRQMAEQQKTHGDVLAQHQQYIRELEKQVANLNDELGQTHQQVVNVESARQELVARNTELYNEKMTVLKELEALKPKEKTE